MWKPILRRVYVFWLPSRSKVKLASGVALYIPNQNTGRFTARQTCFVLRCADDCKLGPSNGLWDEAGKVVVSDGFEISDSPMLDLWEEVKDNPKFAELKKLSEELDSKVVTGIISETSIIAIEE